MSSEPKAREIQSRLKILIITRNLPPLVGGMEKLNWHMAEELSRYGDVIAIGPSEAANTMPEKVAFHSVPLSPLWRFLLTATWTAIKVARSEKPDVILAGSGLTAPTALLAARVSKAKSAAYVHGLDVAVSHSIYRFIWHPCLRKVDSVIANSAPTAELCRLLDIDTAKTIIINPGVQIPHCYESHAKEIAIFKKHHGLIGKKVLLSVGRLTTRKGLREFVSKSLPSIVAQDPSVVLLVVGDAPTASLHAEVQTVQSIKLAAAEKGVAEHIIFVGVITDPRELSVAYYSSDVHVFPVRQLLGDPEGFGMVAIEAAAHGVPTVGFATGGIVDAVSETVSGSLVDPEDYAELSARTIQILVSKTVTHESCKKFAAKFEWKNFGESIKHALEH